MSRRSRLSGFSLIEVLVSIFLIALGGAIFGSLIPSAVRSGRMVANHHQAASLVQHKIDQLRAVGYGRLNYTELVEAGIIDESPDTQPFTFKNVDQLTEFYRDPVATITIHDLNATIKQVTVTLSWSGIAGRGENTVQITTLIARG